MSRIWVVVADQARARIFETDSSKDPLVEIHTEVSTAGKQAQQNLVTDKPGRSYDSMGQGRHAVGKSVDPREQEATGFSRTLAGHLATGKQAGNFEKLIIVAAPHFLGLLRKELDKSIMNSVILELDKDLSKLNAREIREHLPERLQPSTLQS